MTQPAGPPGEISAKGVLRHYWRVVGGRPSHLAIPLVLILLAGAFEGLSFSLLIPLTEAIAEDSFDFLEGSRMFGWVLGLVPASASGTPQRDTYLVVIVVGLVIAARIVKLVIEYATKLYVVPRNERYRVRVGEETFGRVMRFGRMYFDRHAVGRVDAEVGWSTSVMGLLVAMEELLRNGIGLLVKAAVMVGISIPLSIAFILSLPFVNWFMHAVNREVERISRQSVDVDREIRSRMLDILGSIPLVKAYSQEEQASAAYAATLKEAEVLAVRRDKVVGLRYPVEEVVILITMMLVQTVVIVVQGNFAPGDLAPFGAFLIVLQQALRDYKYFSQFSLQVSQEIPRLDAVAGLFSDEGKFIVPSGPEPFARLEKAIELKGVDFQYQEGVDTLSDISATIPAGAVTAIVGPTGAGKTTLVDLIARLYDCAPGAILLDGRDIRDFALPTLHARMAIVSQDVWLLNRTLRENLTFGLAETPDDSALLEAIRAVELGDFADGLRDGLDTEIGDRGVQLSGGQRQRVALARALLRDPDILILDEATSSLDSVIEQRVAQAIMDRAEGRTLIIIAHRLSTIRGADQILVLQGGRLVESGSWEELVASGGMFADLHTAQFGGAAGA